MADTSLPLKVAKRDERIRQLEGQVQNATNESARLRDDMASINEYYMGELERVNVLLSQASDDGQQAIRAFVEKVGGTKSKFAKEARILLGDTS